MNGESQQQVRLPVIVNAVPVASHQVSGGAQDEKRTPLCEIQHSSNNNTNSSSCQVDWQKGIVINEKNRQVEETNGVRSTSGVVKFEDKPQPVELPRLSKSCLPHEAQSSDKSNNKSLDSSELTTPTESKPVKATTDVPRPAKRNIPAAETTTTTKQGNNIPAHCRGKGRRYSNGRISSPLTRLDELPPFNCAVVEEGSNCKKQQPSSSVRNRVNSLEYGGRRRCKVAINAAVAAAYEESPPVWRHSAKFPPSHQPLSKRFFSPTSNDAQPITRTHQRGEVQQRQQNSLRTEPATTAVYDTSTLDSPTNEEQKQWLAREIQTVKSSLKTIKHSISERSSSLLLATKKDKSMLSPVTVSTKPIDALSDDLAPSTRASSSNYATTYYKQQQVKSPIHEPTISSMLKISMKDITVPAITSSKVSRSPFNAGCTTRMRSLESKRGKSNFVFKEQKSVEDVSPPPAVELSLKRRVPKSREQLAKNISQSTVKDSALNEKHCSPEDIPLMDVLNPSCSKESVEMIFKRLLDAFSLREGLEMTSQGGVSQRTSQIALERLASRLKQLVNASIAVEQSARELVVTSFMGGAIKVKVIIGAETRTDQWTLSESIRGELASNIKVFEGKLSVVGSTPQRIIIVPTINDEGALSVVLANCLKASLNKNNPSRILTLNSTSVTYSAAASDEFSIEEMIRDGAIAATTTSTAAGGITKQTEELCARLLLSGMQWIQRLYRISDDTLLCCFQADFSLANVVFSSLNQSYSLRQMRATTSSNLSSSLLDLVVCVTALRFRLSSRELSKSALKLEGCHAKWLTLLQTVSTTVCTTLIVNVIQKIINRSRLQSQDEEVLFISELIVCLELQSITPSSNIVAVKRSTPIMLKLVDQEEGYYHLRQEQQSIDVQQEMLNTVKNIYGTHSLQYIAQLVEIAFTAIKRGDLSTHAVCQKVNNKTSCWCYVLEVVMREIESEGLWPQFTEAVTASSGVVLHEECAKILLLLCAFRRLTQMKFREAAAYLDVALNLPKLSQMELFALHTNAAIVKGKMVQKIVEDVVVEHLRRAMEIATRLSPYPSTIVTGATAFNMKELATPFLIAGLMQDQVEWLQTALDIKKNHREEPQKLLNLQFKIGGIHLKKRNFLAAEKAFASYVVMASSIPQPAASAAAAAGDSQVFEAKLNLGFAKAGQQTSLAELKKVVLEITLLSFDQLANTEGKAKFSALFEIAEVLLTFAVPPSFLTPLYHHCKEIAIILADQNLFKKVAQKIQ